MSIQIPNKNVRLLQYLLLGQSWDLGEDFLDFFDLNA